MIPRLHVVTNDEVLARSDVVRRSVELLRISAGIALHVRAPGAPGRRLFDVARAIAEVAGGSRLFVNDRLDVALAIPECGAHLRHSSLPPTEARTLLGANRRLGASVRADGGALPDGEEMLDFLFAGTAFPTPSHPEGPVAGPDRVGALAGLTSTPILAIGGISRERIGVLLDAGVYGVAVIRSVWSDPHPVRAAESLLEAFE